MRVSRLSGAWAVLACSAAIACTAPTAAPAQDSGFAALTVVEEVPGRYRVELAAPAGALSGSLAVVPPRGCAMAGAPREVRWRGGAAVRMEMACDADGIRGQALRLEGIGDPALRVDVELRTLDGREYAALLPPGVREAILPLPPGLAAAGAAGLGAGFGRGFSLPALWLLAACAVLAGVPGRPLAAAAGAFAAAYFAGGWLAGREELAVSLQAVRLLTLLAAAAAALALTRNARAGVAALASPWLLAALLGALAGAAGPSFPPALSSVGTGIAQAAAALGATAVLVGAGMVAATFRWGARGARAEGASSPADARRVAAGGRQVSSAPPGDGAPGPVGDQPPPVASSSHGRGAGQGVRQLDVDPTVTNSPYGRGVPDAPAGDRPSSAVLLLLAAAAALVVPALAGLPSLLAEPAGAPFAELFLAAALLGFAGPASGLRLGAAPAVTFLLLLTAGTGLPPAFMGIEVVRTAALAALFVVAGRLVLGGRVDARYALPAAVLAPVALGGYLRQLMAETAAFPVSVLAGAALAATLVLLAGQRFAELVAPAWRARAGRGVGVGAAVLIVAARLGDHLRWGAREAVAGGSLPIPLLALGLIAVAVLAWPRRRRVAEALGFHAPKGTLHLAALAGAFFLLPFGTLQVGNPFSPPAPPSQADHLVADLLHGTYHAFNLTDEAELYDRLSQSVTGTLVADLYLDSRRRLRAGTAEGDEVTVREVALLDLHQAPLAASMAGTESGEAAFRASWRVTARVRHLQHVHERQNLYAGTLRLRMEDGRWKLADVVLTGEERILSPWSSQ